MGEGGTPKPRPRRAFPRQLGCLKRSAHPQPPFDPDSGEVRATSSPLRVEFLGGRSWERKRDPENQGPGRPPRGISAASWLRTPATPFDPDSGEVRASSSPPRVEFWGGRSWEPKRDPETKAQAGLFTAIRLPPAPRTPATSLDPDSGEVRASSSPPRVEFRGAGVGDARETSKIKAQACLFQGVRVHSDILRTQTPPKPTPAS